MTLPTAPSSGFATALQTKPRPQALTSGEATGVFRTRRRELYPGGPYVSGVGFGSYRIGFLPQLGYPECQAALLSALQKGVNLIDTSTNYGDGQSELLIGKTLRHTFEERQVDRGEVVVVSKVGYVQGSNMELAKMRETEGRPFPGMTKFGDGVWHCIHPQFIRDQWARSQARLGLETLDVYLLHNPEYMLKRFAEDGVPVEEARQRFYQALKESFEALELLVEEGAIVAYGVSSNTFGQPSEDPTSVSLRECLAVAASVSPTHHFRVAQMPMNWLEVGPGFIEFDDRQESALGFAAANRIGVLINRPLNAMYNNGLIRLARPPEMDEAMRATLDERNRNGLINWSRLASDLEKLAKMEFDTPGYEDAPLSQLALASLMWQPGVTSVLCGMRQVRYVHDAEQAAARPTLVRGHDILRRIYEGLEFH